MAGGFRSGFGVAFGVVIGLVVAAGLVFFGCPMLVCGGLGAIGIAASEADRAQRESTQSPPVQETRPDVGRASEPIQALQKQPAGDSQSDDARTVIQAKPKLQRPPPTIDDETAKRVATSAKAALSFLSKGPEIDSGKRFNLVRQTKVRWVGSVTGTVKKEDGNFNLIARCSGVRVQCTFEKTPPDRIMALKKDTRIAVYGTMFDFEDVPKRGPTIKLWADQVNTFKPTTTAPVGR